MLQDLPVITERLEENTSVPSRVLIHLSSTVLIHYSKISQWSSELLEKYTSVPAIVLLHLFLTV